MKEYVILSGVGKSVLSPISFQKNFSQTGNSTFYGF